jgi:hypothetical protein
VILRLLTLGVLAMLSLSAPLRAADPDQMRALQAPAARLGPIWFSGLYTVQKHDTLGELSIRMFGTVKRVADLVRWNGLSNANRLRPGQKLIVGDDPTLTVAQGDRALLSMWRHSLEVRGPLPLSKQVHATPLQETFRQPASSFLTPPEPLQEHQPGVEVQEIEMGF